MKNNITSLALTSIALLACAPAYCQGGGGQNASVTAAAPAPASSAGMVDPKILTLLNSVEAKYKSMNSLSVETHTATTYSEVGQPPKLTNMVIDYSLQRPNYSRVVLWKVQPDPSTGKVSKTKFMLEVEDGANFWTWDATRDQYHKGSLNLTNGSGYPGLGELLSAFYTELPMESKLNGKQTSLMGIPLTLVSAGIKENQPWNGATYSVVEMANSITIARMSATITMKEELYIGQDMLVHRVVSSTSTSKGTDGLTSDEYITSIKINPTIDKTAFQFTPPPGAGLDKLGAHSLEAAAPPAPPVLKNGSIAPDFTVQDPNGKPVKLSDYAGKVVVIDFWATWCGPCQKSLPHTNDVADKYKSQNVVFLAINSWDSADAFKAWLPQHKNYDGLNFVIDPAQGKESIAMSLYHVSGIPTQIVIDKTGKIVDSFVGFAGPTDDLENAIKAANG